MIKRVNAGPRALRRGRAWLAVAVGSTLASMQGAMAQSPGQVTIDARRCMELESPQDRLACYEAEVGAALGADKAEPAEPADAAEPAEPAESAESTATAEQAAPRAVSSELPNPVEERSVRESRAERRAHSREAAKHSQVEIVGTIAALQERLPNQLVITLEDGQVWAQTAPEHYQLRVGNEVRIRSSRWGEMYRLSNERLRGFILVKRVQ